VFDMTLQPAMLALGLPLVTMSCEPLVPSASMHKGTDKRACLATATALNDLCGTPLILLVPVKPTTSERNSGTTLVIATL
jgi:hypothetical protein